jgi:transcriptional antiterminator RfaH
MRWFVIHTRANAEKQALLHLGNQGFTAYLPCYGKRRSHARRIDTIRAPVFPRYLFIQMDTERAPWRAIRSTVGVVDVIRHGDQPVPVPQGVVESIQAREDQSGLVIIADQFHRGEKLRISAGAFRGHTGLFECSGDQARVIVLLELLGRSVRVSVSAQAVARAA